MFKKWWSNIRWCRLLLHENFWKTRPKVWVFPRSPSIVFLKYGNSFQQNENAFLLISSTNLFWCFLNFGLIFQLFQKFKSRQIFVIISYSFIRCWYVLTNGQKLNHTTYCFLFFVAETRIFPTHQLERLIRPECGASFQTSRCKSLLLRPGSKLKIEMNYDEAFFIWKDNWHRHCVFKIPPVKSFILRAFGNPYAVSVTEVIGFL